MCQASIRTPSRRLFACRILPGAPARRGVRLSANTTVRRFDESHLWLSTINSGDKAIHLCASLNRSAPETSMSSDSFHISLTNTFICPECGGAFFNSWPIGSTPEREYGCKNDTCGWYGNAEQAFTIPRVDPWLQVIFSENLIFPPGMDSSETRILRDSHQLIQMCRQFGQ